MSKVEVKDLGSEGYNKVFRYNEWLVAHLSHNADTDIENIRHFQKHEESDEVFVLLKGKMCLLIVEDIENPIETLEILPLKLNHAYNIPKGVYHQHILSHDANVLIIENANTCDGNSPCVNLTQFQKTQLIEKVKGDANAKL